MCSLLAAEQGRVALVTKDDVQSSNSFLAQGGIAAVHGENDSFQLHVEDTLRTGQGICDEQIVSMIVNAAPSVIHALHRLGVIFDTDSHGDLHLGMEGAHRRPRILHVDGDQTGRGITERVIERVKQHPNIVIYPGIYVTELAMEANQCTGAWAVDSKGVFIRFRSRAVVLATGGLGQLYDYTTNHQWATGDGYALAYQAGAILRDMEFIQFHPTGLRVSSEAQHMTPLISEAVRGEGAKLVNEHGRPFMLHYHEWEDLAPRDVVSRAIFAEMSEGHDVFLDATGVRHFEQRFPAIYRLCTSVGISPRSDLLPVTPVAHYAMGGIATDSYGRSSIPRLFAVGEVASSGLHGANRLASNSLLEALVMAQRAVIQMIKLPSLSNVQYRTTTWPDYFPTGSAVKPDLALLAQIQKIMWTNVGIVREHRQLSAAVEALTDYSQRWPKVSDANHSLLTTSLLVARAALWRTESRGAHFRSDYKEMSVVFQKHSIQVLNVEGQDESITNFTNDSASVD